MPDRRLASALAVACLACLVWVAAAGLARADESADAAADPDAPFALAGSWHVLVHYQDAEAPDPTLWHWEDRVWDFRREGAHVVWTEYLLVQFADNEGRFTDLGTNMAARVYGAWEPNFRQREEIENGLRVLERSRRSQRLEPDGEGGWRSLGGAEQLAAAAEGSVYLSHWRIGGDASRPVFEQVDELRRVEGAERIGATLYATERRERDPEVVRGRYRRDGRLTGRFRMVRARIARRLEEAAPAGGGVRLGRGEGLKLPVALWAWLAPWHYLADRTVRVETTPPDAVLDLAYLRRGTQLDYRRVRAPVTVALPRRATATPADALWIRASADGYRRDRIAVPVRSGRDAVRIDLEPLANVLAGVAHRTLAAHSALELFTDEEPVIRSRRTRDAMTLILAETRLGDGVSAQVDAVRGPHLASASARQVGHDLVLRLRLSERARLEGARLRTFSGRDAARDRTVTVLDWSLPGDEAARVERLRSAVDGVGAERVSGCALAFEGALREALAPAELHRALAASPHFVRPALRASLRRLGALRPDGRLALSDGARLDPARPLELEAALERAERVEGLLVFLRALVDALERAELRDAALRGLVAPEVAPTEFARALEDAREAEARCGVANASPGMG